METKGHFAAVGAFTLLGFLGMLGFFLWIAQIELDAETALYDVDFASVSGLSEASDVRFAGLSVGRVILMQLSPENPGLIRVRIEIDATTPVRSDSIATVEAQGVTGVSYVGIDAGSASAPLLREASDREIPLITTGRSSFQSITDAAPELLSETLDLMRDLRQVTGDANQERIGRILENVEDASLKFSAALDDFSQVSETVAAFADEISTFNKSLDSLSGDASGTLRTTDEAFSTINTAAGDAQVLIKEGRTALAEASERFGAVTTDISDAAKQLSQLSDRAEKTLDETSASIASLSGRAEETLGRADASLAEVDRTLAALRDVADPGKQALSAAERAFDGMDRALNEDLPGLVDGLQSTLEALDTAVKRVSEDLPEVTADIRNASQSAEAAFAGIEATVRSSGPAIRRFAEEGLPQYGKLATEMRAAVSTLERLLEQLRRDPSRFFIEPRAPEYRR